MWRFERCNWKHLVNVPILYERRRSEYLAVRTGKQLTKMLRKPDKKTTTKDADKAIMRIWQDTAPHFAVAHRVIRDSLLKEAFPKDPPQSWLLVGDSTPWVVAARELWPDKPVKRIQAVEPNEEMAKAAKMLSNQPHIMYNSSIVDVIKAGNSAVGAFEVVVVAWTARERLVNKASHTDEEQCGTVVAPCSHDMKCPMFRSDTKTLECTFNQAYLRCKEGPKLREGTGAGSVIARRQTAEDYAYVCVQKAPRTTFRSARVVGTPLKRDGHVHVDMCMPTAQIQRLMFQRAHMKQDFQEFEGAQMFKDARKAAHGARMIYEYAIPKDFDAADAADQDPLNPRLKSLAEFGEEGSTQRALYQKSLEPTEPMHLITANAGKIMPDSSLKTYQRVQPTVQIFHQGDRTIAHNQQRALAQGDRQSREARGDAFFADRPEVDAMFEPTHTPGGRRL